MTQVQPFRGFREHIHKSDYMQGCDFSAKTRISVFSNARKVILVNHADPV